jgi:cobalt-precorrin 5A hydrolase / precorrin-3B C17-methyltransferase
LELNLFYTEKILDQFLQDFYPLAAIASAPEAIQRLYQLFANNQIQLWVPRSCIEHSPELGGFLGFVVVQGQPGRKQRIVQNRSSKPLQVIPHDEPFGSQLEKLWPSHQCLVFSLPTNEVLDLIAPLLVKHEIKPAVVVIEPSGKYVICLCNGNLGSGDNLTQLLAIHLEAQPVLTGAAAKSRLGVTALGHPFGWLGRSGNWPALSAAIAKGETIQVIQESGSTLWQQHLPEHSFVFTPTSHPANAEPGTVAEVTPVPGATARLWISHHVRCHPIAHQVLPNNHLPPLPEIQWCPRVLWLGIGCETNTSRHFIEKMIYLTFGRFCWAEEAIAGVATLDTKAEERGLLQLCHDRDWPFTYFQPEELQPIKVPNPNPNVEKWVGTPSVAEAAAVRMVLGAAAAQATAEEVASRLLLQKEEYSLRGQPGGITIAIAVADQEYNPAQGKLRLVGVGLGIMSQITPAAQAALIQAHAIIGTASLIDALRSLFRPGQIIESFAPDAQQAWVERAIALAELGLTASILCAGEASIYGMTGFLFEQWHAQERSRVPPQVDVFPGISALQSIATQMSNSLIQDFCAISLSDRSPWEEIERRLQAAAQSGFVTALYHSGSPSSVEPLRLAQQIFLQHRSLKNPVAIVQCVRGQEEQITLTSLSLLHEAPLDQLTAVVIGNQDTEVLIRRAPAR